MSASTASREMGRVLCAWHSGECVPRVHGAGCEARRHHGSREEPASADERLRVGMPKAVIARRTLVTFLASRP